ncbi:AAA family ATPase [Halorubraceae archaeon YAN]|nr:AAA family ATPase [Halorubraceae archaeon YAN]
MNIDERIARRRQIETRPRLVLEYDQLSPVYHLTDPTGRGSLLEQLLDIYEPAFTGEQPENLYLWGPKGSGKSAVVTALFSGFRRLRRQQTAPIYTTTRVDSINPIDFVYVDSREATTQFSLYHTILDQLVENEVPKHGIGTDTIYDQLASWLQPTTAGAVIAIDHVDESKRRSVATLQSQLSDFEESISYTLIGRRAPEMIGCEMEQLLTKQLDRYQTHALIEILTTRLSNGLVRNALSHEQLRTVATWATGDAHDALAAVFSAAVVAETEGSERILDEHLQTGMDSVPQPCVALGQVLSVSESRRAVLRELIALREDDRSSVGTATGAISKRSIDLSPTTVERFLYELAEAGIIKRIQAERESDIGRPPSKIEFQFPTIVFNKLTEYSNTDVKK